MRSLFYFLVLSWFFLQSGITFSQQPRFNLIAAVENNNWGTIADIKQDPRGYIWLSTQLKGLQKYDGSHFISYVNDPRNFNSLATNRVPSIHLDSTGIVWAATYGSGLDKFDPETNSFKHFRHDAKDPGSLANDTVFIVMRDHLHNLWVGTYGGLDMLDEKTNKFVHYRNIPGDTSSLSYNRIWYIYDDSEGTLWIGCGSPFYNLGENPEDGGLNRFNRTTGKFRRFLHDSNDPASIANNKVRALFEDSKGNFWVGSAGDGLQTLDRKKGKFTHYYYDPLHRDNLSRPPVKYFPAGIDHITFIKEDYKGSIWIGTMLNGVNKFDPVTKKITHFGFGLEFTNNNNKLTSVEDTATGFHDFCAWRSLVSRDGLLWISSSTGNLYNIRLSENTIIPYYPINQPEANSFYYEADKNILWIGTLKGLVRKDLNTQTERFWIHDPHNSRSLCSDSIYSLRADGKGNLWIATTNGLSKFNFTQEVFTTYRNNDADPASISGNQLNCLFIDHDGNIWVSPGNWIIDKLDPITNVFTHYKYSESTNLQNSWDRAFCFAEDKNSNLWIGTSGVMRMDQKNGKFYHYLPNTNIMSICLDAANNVWAGADNRLFRYDREHDQFSPFIDPTTKSDIQGILHMLEDNGQNLWISTTSAIIKINDKRNEVRRYAESYGVHKNSFSVADNFKGANGRLFIGDENGYYSFFPGQIKDNSEGPVVNFTSFKIGDKEINTANKILEKPLWQTNKIRLGHNQNTFSLDFFAIDYKTPGEMKYLFMLEKYDDNWHYTGNDHRAYLFNVPAGKYLFRVKAVNSDGNWSEKAIAIIISPPWWETWSFRILSVIALVAVIYAIIKERSRKLKAENILLEKKVNERTQQLQQSIEELKSTQAQLIQSEKMASLGELTAGIAHEIQNPLNFVNNFSEVNKELAGELKTELATGNMQSAVEIADNIIENEEKISHHGKRADAIVKGMLQHSRTSSGQKEPTDINALCDEYLRLAYHGLRAKDKSFNAEIKTDFDSAIGKINIVPQEIGRVILNLINNAFYAVSEKQKVGVIGYEPTVTISTKKMNDRIEVRVRDNGNGIPQKILDKIFQPFFTTKPTGQGTGLGLSLAYDIVKAHGGEIKVRTNEGEGSQFIIQLLVI